MANIARYQPQFASPTMSLRNAIDRLFDDSWIFPRWSDQPFRSAMSHLPANLYEMEDALVVQLALPGIRPEECEITVRENVLTVRGQWAMEAPQNATPLWQGFGGGSFEQSFTLPVAVDSANVEASYEHGILTLHLPKVEQARTKRIPIKTAGS